MTPRPHADLRPTDITCLIDRREQRPLVLSMPTEPATLAAGDYSVRGLEQQVAIERKGLDDLIACCGRERDRFEACIQRLKAYEVRVLLIEASWATIELGNWRSQLKPGHVKGALYSWMKHVSVVLASDRESAGRIASGILFSAARERWRELQSFFQTLKIAGGE